MFSLLLIFLYPYPYQYEAFGISLLIILFFGLAAWGIYRLITWKMNDVARTVFNGLIIVAVIVLIVSFFAELTVSLITIHQVNRQLGFSYATPDTPEGELFEISDVTPGKTMDKAGLKVADQVQMRKCNDLYILLISNQGKEVVIPVTRDKQPMQIRVKVPRLHVPLYGISFISF